MRACNIQFKHILALFLLSSFLSAKPTMAAGDFEAQQMIAKERAKKHQKQSGHTVQIDPNDMSKVFRGIYFGYLPCDDCSGTKTTLSLQQKYNYLLVTQSSKLAAREYYERGKYDWNDDNQTVVLTPRKDGDVSRRFHIKNETTLIQLNEDGTRLDQFVLQRGDTVKMQEHHLH